MQSTSQNLRQNPEGQCDGNQVEPSGSHSDSGDAKQDERKNQQDQNEHMTESPFTGQPEAEMPAFNLRNFASPELSYCVMWPNKRAQEALEGVLSSKTVEDSGNENGGAL